MTALRVAVCLKQVLDTQLPMLIEAGAGQVEQDSSVPIYRLDPIDQCGLELGMTLKKSCGAQVSVLTLGPDRAEEVLRYGLGRGADLATHLVCGETESWDAWSKAEALGQEITRQGCDLALCGGRSTDEGAGLLGPFMAENLDLPQVTSVIGLEIDPQARRLRAYRQLEHGDREIIECRLPALVCVSALAGRPQYVSVQRLKECENKHIVRRQVSIPASTRQPACQVKEFTVPRLRPRKVPAPNPALTASGRMNFLMAGSQRQAKKESKIFEGPVDEAVRRVVDYLKEQGFI
jgi:electron transfer flavoprotein beta subunit